MIKVLVKVLRRRKWHKSEHTVDIAANNQNKQTELQNLFRHDVFEEANDVGQERI